MAFVIHAAPGETVTFCGAPTVVTRTIAFVCGSISYTLSSRWFTTQTAWALASTKALPGLTAIVFVSVGGPGSTRQHSREWVGDPDGAGRDGEVVEGPGGEANPAGDAVRARVDPNDCAFGWPRWGPPRSITHKAPEPTAIAVAEIPSIVATTWFVRASTREIVDFR